MAGHIEHDPGAQGFAREPAARSARRNGKTVVGGVPHDCNDIPHVPRRDHALRHNTIAARVRAVGDAMDDIRKDVPSDEFHQVGGNL